MSLHGQQILGGEATAQGSERFPAVDPTTGEPLAPSFFEATAAEVDRALEIAAAAAAELAASDRRAELLRCIAQGLEVVGEPLLERAELETALPRPRLEGERGRTCFQLRMFADLIDEGSWVQASIDTALPDRTPIPKPDLRRMLRPLGPVVVFGASNFPLAYSVAGGDTASALAAGCPVVVKGHPNHPGTSEIVGTIVAAAVREVGLPAGVFALLHGKGYATGEALVRHPAARAVGFTGSLHGGRALFDLAAARPEPIPVFAEMGSTNPVFFLPGALHGDGATERAAQAAASVTLGVGQFCTNPGLMVAQQGADLERFVAALREGLAAAPPGTMLHRGICANYEAGLASIEATAGLVAEVQPAREGRDSCVAHAGLYRVPATRWLAESCLSTEIFGPTTILIECADHVEMCRVAEGLHGQLTASVHGTDADGDAFTAILDRVAGVAGRVIANGFPTGVEVCDSMVHGGPYPATTDSRTTSVGSAAIQRFARPVSFQNLSQAHLPAELRDENPRGILRQVDGGWTTEPLQP